MMEYTYQSGKAYLANVGLSCSWIENGRLEGDALFVALIFESTELDYCNFVVDFGSLKGMKGWLEDTFDHKLLVCSGDTDQMNWIKQMQQLRIVDAVQMDEPPGLKSFARLILECADIWLQDNGYTPRVTMKRVSVSTRTDSVSINAEDLK